MQNFINKRKKTVIIITILSCLVGLIFALMVRPSYRAEIVIAIQPTDAIDVFSQDAQAISEHLRHQVEIIKSSRVVDDAIDKLHLRITDVLNPRRPRESFLKHIRVKPAGNSLIKITATAQSPQLATGMCSQLAKSFLQLHKEKMFFVSQAAMEWLFESGKLAKQLKETENKLLKFIKEKDMINPQQELDNYQENTDRLIKEKAKLLLSAEENEQILQKLRELTEEKDATEIITQQLPPDLADLLGSYREEYIPVQAEIDQLLKIYKPDYPGIVELNQKKQSIIENTESRIEELLTESREEIDYAKGRIPEIEAGLEKGKGKYSDLLDRKKEFDTLKEKLENLKKLREKAKGQLEAGSFSIISASIIGFTEEGWAPVAKVRPIKGFLIIFTITGLIAGIVLAFYLERSGSRKL